MTYTSSHAYALADKLPACSNLLISGGTLVIGNPAARDSKGEFRRMYLITDHRLPDFVSAEEYLNLEQLTYR